MTDEEFIERIRLLLGNPDQETIPDTVILTFLQVQKLQFDYTNHPETAPYIIYNTLVACLRWLIAKDITSGESLVTRRREKIGQEEIEVELSGNSISSWKDFLDFIEANPDYIDPALESVRGLVVIGGVREDEYHRVKWDPNSRDTYSSGSLMHRKRGFYDIGCWPYRRR